MPMMGVQGTTWYAEQWVRASFVRGQSSAPKTGPGYLGVRVRHANGSSGAGGGRQHDRASRCGPPPACGRRSSTSPPACRHRNQKTASPHAFVFCKTAHPLTCV
eukprot:365955-Chlamydomonas_euryale.AAC.3